MDYCLYCLRPCAVGFDYCKRCAEKLYLARPEDFPGEQTSEAR